MPDAVDGSKRKPPRLGVARARVQTGSSHDPFEVLGLHETPDRRHEICVFLPPAESVTLEGVGRMKRIPGSDCFVFELQETDTLEQHYRLTLDEFLVLVPIRAQDDIRDDIEQSREDEERAREEKRNAEQLERLARDQLDAQKSEIDAIKARLKVAKNDDREADAIVLESDKKLAEGAKQLLEKRRDLRKKEIDGWDAVAKLAQATRKAAAVRASTGANRKRSSALGVTGPHRVTSGRGPASGDASTRSGGCCRPRSGPPAPRRARGRAASSR